MLILVTVLWNVTPGTWVEISQAHKSQLTETQTWSTNGNVLTNNSEFESVTNAFLRCVFAVLYNFPTFREEGFPFILRFQEHPKVDAVRS